MGWGVCSTQILQGSIMLRFDSHVAALPRRDAMTRTALMGIVNLTPDSFSGDGLGRHHALERSAQLVEEGAHWLDLGAESTRPGAQAVEAHTEWARLEPVLRDIDRAPWRRRIGLSVDTRHPSTAARALDLGADLINDVTGLRQSDMRAVLKHAQCDIVVMHALVIPADPAVVWPADQDPVASIQAWAHQVSALAADHGIDPQRLIFDPGLGFGKTWAQSIQLIHAAPRLLAGGGRWLFGHSRKGFLKLIQDLASQERDPATLALSTGLILAGVHLLRVHAVGAHRQLLEQLAPSRVLS